VKFQVLGTHEPTSWYETLSHFSEKDVYFLPEYHRAHELNGDGVARAFVAEEGNELLFYPFLVRPIHCPETELTRENWNDIETVYGYSGPLCTSTNPAFLAAAWKAFSEWCQQERIVAEFIRFNPFLNCQRYMSGPYHVELDRETVALRLDASESALWSGYSSVHRNMVRKAVTRGLKCGEVSPTEGQETFKQIYFEAMDQVRAHPYYYFSDAYFNHLCNALGENLRLFTVRNQDQLVAAALFLQYGESLHYHLAANNKSGKESAAANLLLHTVAQWGSKRGLRWLHLGGGRTPDPKDSLLRFKSHISAFRLPFYTGKRIHDHDVYNKLCSKWMLESGLPTKPNYFLLYRLEQEVS
tara:strand:- start:25230 stop:26297 length:1068 start_codon:yes stop_codon:yes gene_type:complete